MLLGEKVSLAGRIWYWYLRIRWQLRHGDLPAVVDWLGGRVVPAPMLTSRRLGRIIDRALPVWPTGARCLHRSLVLFALLPRDGAEIELVLGLPREPSGHDAHAWIEVAGVDVGPPPGGRGYRVLARYSAGHPPSASERGASHAEPISKAMRSRPAS